MRRKRNRPYANIDPMVSDDVIRRSTGGVRMWNLFPMTGEIATFGKGFVMLITQLIAEFVVVSKQIQALIEN